MYINNTGTDVPADEVCILFYKPMMAQCGVGDHPDLMVCGSVSAHM